MTRPRACRRAACRQRRKFSSFRSQRWRMARPTRADWAASLMVREVNRAPTARSWVSESYWEVDFVVVITSLISVMISVK